jgi:hypothetical protein
MKAPGGGLCTLILAVPGMALAGLALSVATAQAQEASFGIASFALATSSQQAGAHADVHSEFMLNTNERGEPVGQVKNARIRLPAGIVGNPLTIPRCTPIEFETDNCQPPAQVGVLTVFYKIGSQPTGHTNLALYNLTPSPGHAATFAAAQLSIKILMQANLSTDGAYALEVAINDLSTEIPIVGTSLTLWGVPAASTHDLERSRTELGGPQLIYGPPNGSGEREVIGIEPTPAGVAPTPLVSNSSDCEGPSLTSTLLVESWGGQSDQRSSTMPAPSGCGLLSIAPTISVTPETTRRDTPSGYNVDLDYPLAEDPFSLATPSLRSATLTLPAGTSLSPGVANGLVGCTEAQLEAGACPNASKVGTAVIKTPLLADPLEGTIDLSTPTPAAMYRLFVSVAGEGLAVHLIGVVHADPNTGQLTVVFAESPPLPFSALDLHLFGGGGAALANPVTCGEATTSGSFVSYGGQSASASSSFDIDANGSGGTCSSPSSFTPAFLAGTISAQAGSFSPFTLTVTREDGQQSLGGITANLPQGLMGMLSQVPACGEPAASQGSCPQSSLVGSAEIGAGAGPNPLDLSGSLYLTGPYRGAPFGLAIVVPAIVGPFDLGTIVVRAQIRVAPNDLHLVIATDPLPQILSGIPLRVRRTSLTVSRPDFTVNPTNCSPSSVAATIESAQGASFAASSPFQVSGCQGLPFAPKLAVATLAKASSRGNGASLNVRVTNAAGTHENLASVAVELPKPLKARLTTVQQACVGATFAVDPGACPQASVVGRAVVDTPVVGTSLSGPVYLVFHRGVKYPELVTILQGSGVQIQLTGSLNVSRGTSSTVFTGLPDISMSLFELDLPEGPHSVLGATENLCAKRQSMTYTMVGQNGVRSRAEAMLGVEGCHRHAARSGGRGRAKTSLVEPSVRVRWRDDDQT